MPLGIVVRRPETPEDSAFRWRLYIQSGVQGADHVALPDPLRRVLLRQRFAASPSRYRAACPEPDNEIVEFDGAPVGRLAIEREARVWRLVDLVFLRDWRRRGLGRAVLAQLCAEAREAHVLISLTLQGAQADLARRCESLGFETVRAGSGRLTMEWRPGAAAPASEHLALAG